MPLDFGIRGHKHSTALLSVPEFGAAPNLQVSPSPGQMCHEEDKLAICLRDWTAGMDARGSKPMCRNGNAAVRKTAGEARLTLR